MSVTLPPLGSILGTTVRFLKVALYWEKTKAHSHIYFGYIMPSLLSMNNRDRIEVYADRGNNRRYKMDC